MKRRGPWWARRPRSKRKQCTCGYRRRHGLPDVRRCSPGAAPRLHLGSGHVQRPARRIPGRVVRGGGRDADVDGHGRHQEKTKAMKLGIFSASRRPDRGAAWGPDVGRSARRAGGDVHGDAAGLDEREGESHPRRPRHDHQQRHTSGAPSGAGHDAGRRGPDACNGRDGRHRGPVRVTDFRRAGHGGRAGLGRQREGDTSRWRQAAGVAYGVGGCWGGGGRRAAERPGYAGCR